MEESNRRKVLPDFKYYKGEDIHDNPYPYGDVRGRYWYGEMMFSGIVENNGNEDETIQEWGRDVPRWREWLKEHKPNQSERFLRENTERQLAIAAYIVALFAKWCPYDSEDFIYDY